MTLDFNDSFLDNLNKDNIAVYAFRKIKKSYIEHKFFEITYCLKGSAKYKSNHIEATISEGDYFISDYNSKYKFIPTNDKDFYVVSCAFMPEIIDKSLENNHSFMALVNSFFEKYGANEIGYNPVHRIYHDNDNNIFMLFNKLYYEYSERQQGYLEMMRSALVEIVIKTIREISSYEKVINLKSVSEYIKDYVKKNFSKNISLSNICKELNYSLPFISSKFKEQTGETFNDYLQRTRIEAACVLLENDDRKLYEIVSSVGYSDVKYFRKIFKKYKNVSVSDYKNIATIQSKEK